MAGDPRVQQILDRALADVAGARSTSDLEQVRVRVLGRSGELTTLLRSLGSIPAAERPKVGEQANRAKGALEERLAARLDELKAAERPKVGEQANRAKGELEERLAARLDELKAAERR
ncbi:MAG TPA: hypothetical protein VJX92_16805, partial [Methylomirabilota bacterium]|nr:hypothetical protein [Methylomirabilota bacterium]